MSDISTDELRDVLIPVRLILETQACLRALPSMTEENFATLYAIAEDMRSVALANRAGALLALVDLDATYHEYLTGWGGQYHTSHVWRLIQPRIRAGFYRLGSGHANLLEIADEHHTLLAAIRTRDPQIAADALETHICTTQLALLDTMARQAIETPKRPS